MELGKSQPVRIHKNLVIRALEAHPEDLKMVFPDGPYATATEAIEALRAHPGTWIVDGVLSVNISDQAPY